MVDGRSNSNSTKQKEDRGVLVLVTEVLRTTSTTYSRQSLGDEDVTYVLAQALLVLYEMIVGSAVSVSLV